MHAFDFFIETSAKTGVNMEPLFVRAAQILYERNKLKEGKKSLSILPAR